MTRGNTGTIGKGAAVVGIDTTVASRSGATADDPSGVAVIWSEAIAAGKMCVTAGDAHEVAAG